MEQYIVNPPNATARLAIDAAGRLRDLEIGLSRLVCAAPLAGRDAMDAVGIRPGDFHDDDARLATAAALVVARPDPALMFRLAKRAGVPEVEAKRLITSFCPACAAAGRSCPIAELSLPSLARRVAAAIRRWRDAESAYEIALRALRRVDMEAE